MCKCSELSRYHSCVHLDVTGHIRAWKVWAFVIFFLGYNKSWLNSLLNLSWDIYILFVYLAVCLWLKVSLALCMNISCQLVFESRQNYLSRISSPWYVSVQYFCLYSQLQCTRDFVTSVQNINKCCLLTLVVGLMKSAFAESLRIRIFKYTLFMLMSEVYIHLC